MTMYDPQRDPHRVYGGAFSGIWSAFVPRGAVGIIGGVIILLLVTIVSGVLSGPTLIAAIAAIVVLMALIPRAIRAEIRREDRSAVRNDRDGSLPDDSQISDEERREAMRQFDDQR